MKSAFGGFTGFKTTPVTSSSAFSFLANINTTSSTTTTSTTTTVSSSENIASNGASKVLEKVDVDKTEDPTKIQTLSSTSKKPCIERGSEKTKNNSSEYYAKLKGLNESVAQWIKTHVDANPFCILTPIFKDYENYLKEIVSKEENAKTQTLCKTELAKHRIKIEQNDNKDVSAEKKLDSSPFGVTNTNTKTTLAGAEWKLEKSIFDVITSSNTKPIFGNAEQKLESPKSAFGNADATSDARRSIFGSIDSSMPSKSIFGNANVEKNPFLHKPTSASDSKTNEEQTKSDVKPVAPAFPSSTFSFGQSSTSSNITAGFSFGR